ncbi:polysaccharide/polyolphosphate ABC transporter ATPase [Bifidobacterium pullorum subsp. saeculare DSM 6531 = LMG 14934]|uniref:Polysaccharide/polyolphosphate ABC transporter ATPase n=1 Tax=Bifidobacterium pullorum subsp. saeculare DSM 6531 = LMG 14934 TaxID=1437611 RepID=A0A087CQD1_9BIFI|nr:ABC transporter ATP-binding protein [Bifidobacterium pullorum]KFI85481.1 polysaccharide/polyolphosphate ABC transporter ATPase [Bifidobacterium pullorum subsp. saeculare DSM 6531 = LMG 14934]
MSRDNNQDIVINVQNVTKSFKLPIDKASSLKQAIFNRIKGERGYVEQTVLRDVSFQIHKGDFFGIVGRNGSGKSTLLKLMAQIYSPNSGSITVNGTLIPFIELGVGFSPELSGHDNVYLNGALMGFSTHEIDKMYDDIVDFAELGNFMEQKIKNYSSGMLVRLAFSMAIRAQSDILLLDEILAVGDEAFQRKCYAYFAKLKKERKTVVLVTHSMDSVQMFCNKALMLEDGQITVLGKTSEVAKRYREVNNQVAEQIDSKDNIQSSDYVDLQCDFKNDVECNSLNFSVNIISKMDLDDIVLTFVIRRDTGEWVYRFASDEKIDTSINLKNGIKKQFCIKLQNIFPNGRFEVIANVKKRDRTIEYALEKVLTTFEVVNQSTYANDQYWKPKEEYTID